MDNVATQMASLAMHRITLAAIAAEGEGDAKDWALTTLAEHPACCAYWPECSHTLAAVEARIDRDQEPQS